MTERLVMAARAQQLGDPFMPGTTIGPLISVRQRDRVHGYIEGARHGGARILTDGGPPATVGAADPSCFCTPALVSGADPGSRIVQEEVFGPVGVLTSFRDTSEAVSLANGTRYGLAAAIWTPTCRRRVSSQIDADMVWVNEYYAHVAAMPFGGYKQSGIGKDYSLHAPESYSQVKEVTIRYGS